MFGISFPVDGCVWLAVLLYICHTASVISYFAFAPYDCVHVEIPERPADIHDEHVETALLQFMPLVILLQSLIAILPALFWPFVKRISVKSRDIPVSDSWKQILMMILHLATCIGQIYTMSSFVNADSNLSFSWGLSYTFSRYLNISQDNVPDMFPEHLILAQKAEHFVRYYVCEFPVHQFHNYFFVGIYWFMLSLIAYRTMQLIVLMARFRRNDGVNGDRQVLITSGKNERSESDNPNRTCN